MAMSNSVLVETAHRFVQAFYAALAEGTRVRVVMVATCVEALLAPLGRPHTLAQATAVRARAAQALAGWSHVRCGTESEHIDRLLERAICTLPISLPNASWNDA